MDISWKFDTDGLAAHLNSLNHGGLVVAYGGGVDSTAMLILLQRAGVRPDLITFADTRAEKPETYAFLDTMDEWLVSVGFPKITRVAYKPTTSAYNDLEGKMLANETLPSPAFGGHSCSLGWKITPQDYLLRGCSRGINSCEPHPLFTASQESGRRLVKLIGYDDSDADRRRAGKVHGKENPLYDVLYPLQMVGWKRSDCVQAIREAGLPVPVKSACWFCPSSKKWEIYWLAAEHPELYLRACAMERNWLEGKHEQGSTKGLGRKFSWTAWGAEMGITDAEGRVVMGRDELLERAAELRGEGFGNAQDERLAA